MWERGGEGCESGGEMTGEMPVDVVKSEKGPWSYPGILETAAWRAGVIQTLGVQ